MKNYGLFMLLCFLGFQGYSQQMATWDYNSFNSKSLTFRACDSIFRNKTIVGLGEQTHNVVTTFEAKTKMIKYLHDSLGYNVLIFESGFYDCSKAYDNIKRGDTSLSNIRKGIFGVWNVKEMDDLYRYILKTQQTKNPHQLVGMDIQFIRHARDSFMYEFGQMTRKLAKLTQPLHLDSGFANALYNEVSASNYAKVSTKDTLLLSKNLERILSLLETVDTNDGYFSFWRQNVINAIFEYRKYYYRELPLRDSLMAENVH